jgi:hypothetical protein
LLGLSMLQTYNVVMYMLDSGLCLLDFLCCLNLHVGVCLAESPNNQQSKHK